jgi:acetyltransferase
MVRSDLKGEGLGTALMTKMINYCRSRGVGQIVGRVLEDNVAMINLCRKLGFEVHPMPEIGRSELQLRLE